MKPHILIIDDELSICVTLMMALKNKYEVQYAMSKEEGIALLKSQPFELVLLDLRIGSSSGLDVLREIKKLSRNTAVIMMTAYSSVDTAVEAMKCGAFTYLSKPLHLEEMLLSVEQALTMQNLNEKVEYLSNELQIRENGNGMIGKSPEMQRVFGLIDKVKDLNVEVLITGESGTGKELVARAIHFTGSRRDGPFVAVNCAAIPEGLIEEELFGHRKGSFTGAVGDKTGKFEQANHGTMFLDEIGDMPLPMQSKLLRVLQEKAYTPVGDNKVRKLDVRIIAATNRNLDEMVEQGEFRLDLLYRIRVMEIKMPPLRDRVLDIPYFCRHFICVYGKKHNKTVNGMTKEVEKILFRYKFPGNVRELSNLIEYCVIVCTGDTITAEDLPAWIPCEAEGSGMTVRKETSEPDFANMTLREIEREVLIQRLQKNHGNRTQTARELGISVRGLRNKINEYGL